MSAFPSAGLVFGEVTIDQLPVAEVSGVFALMLSTGTVVAKVNIAKRTPLEPRAKATKARGLKRPDSEA